MFIPLKMVLIGIDPYPYIYIVCLFKVNIEVNKPLIQIPFRTSLEYLRILTFGNPWFLPIFLPGKHVEKHAVLHLRVPRDTIGIGFLRRSTFTLSIG